MKPTFLSVVKGYVAPVVVALTFAWSALSIYTHRPDKAPPGVDITLRICHWQLETGVRDAFNEMAADYQKLHPNVRIVQEAIPESTYGQWITTQLMGGVGPDLVEVGKVPYNVLLGYYNRYMMPLSTYTAQPNPYNAGTEFEGVPWRKTYKDAMRGGYVEEVQEYMAIPLSQFGIRIFYNRGLFKQLTGMDTPPQDFRGFIAVCEKIKTRRDPEGRFYTPITASKYHIGYWDAYISDILTFNTIHRADFNRDGAVGSDELFVACKTGRLDMGYEPFRARFGVLRLLCDQFQPGFTGLSRDEAVFLFAQQKAVFIATGTWDASSLMEQARGTFDVGVMNFPAVEPDDPEFGFAYAGPRYERPEGAFKFGITRTCEHPEVALDFLRFLASKQGNEKMNQVIGWIPAIRDTELRPMLRAFEPNLEGVFSCDPFQNLGGETFIRWEQLMALFHVGQITYDQLRKQYEPFYLTKGVNELAENQRNRRRGVFRDDQFLAGFRARAMAATGDEREQLWLKYRQLASSRLVTRDLANSRLMALYNKGLNPDSPGPYEMTPELLERVRQHLKQKLERGGPAR
ncbi:MAG: extracellular solute-binding protein [Phycisphaera sp.]|nr:extracellular solute-binding protein [Phycisphaera sp.]